MRIPKDGAAFAGNAQNLLLRMLTAQRHATTPRPGTDGGEMGHVIGGQVVATELSADGISQRVIHAWPDKLGELIQPAPIIEEMRALPEFGERHVGGTPIASMNRKQRRALARAS